MAYQALYRKYRPTNFDEVVGQRHIVQTLRNAIEKNRIAHAYLFCGPRGTGKTSIAKIFARILNCTQDNPPCIECENCRLSLSGNHP
ncbi:MAG: AAA family ATPase, partial [Allobaculum sp.]|nr:AAA family ATPase [Allobaculum sp.]